MIVLRQLDKERSEEKWRWGRGWKRRGQRIWIVESFTDI